jgi:hypothetical protein
MKWREAGKNVTGNCTMWATSDKYPKGVIYEYPNAFYWSVWMSPNEEFETGNEATLQKAKQAAEAQLTLAKGKAK